MSLSQEQMLDVMAFADDELEGDDRDRVAKLVEGDDEAAELLASLRAIGEGVRSAVDLGRRDVDVRDVVMAKITPNDLDKARIKRTARTRMVVVGASLVALAAAVLLYVRHTSQTVATNPPKAAPSADTVLASSRATGVQVDFVDSEMPASVFFVPADSASTNGAKTERPSSVVVWIDDPPPASPASSSPPEKSAP